MTSELTTQLSDLLIERDAHVTLSPSRIARSIVYDGLYAVSLFACVFLQKRSRQDERITIIKDEIVRLAFFLAPRVSAHREFVTLYKSKQHHSSTFFSALPSLLANPTYDEASRYLLGTGELRRLGGDLCYQPPTAREILGPLYRTILSQGMFTQERHAINELLSLRISLRDIGAR